MMYLWYLPLCQNLHVISTDENRVVAAVQEWNQNETYNLYVSDTSGVYYTLALENVVSSMGPEGNVMVDLYEVNNIDLAGIISNLFFMYHAELKVLSSLL